MKPIFYTPAQEAYQGESALAPAIAALDKARKLYAKDEHTAVKILEEMVQHLQTVFNFKNLSLQVNATLMWFGSTTTVGRFTFGNGATKYFSNDDFEQATNTYRFKKPIADVNLSLYAPTTMDTNRFTTREVMALIVREIGYSFFAWGAGRKAEESIRHLTNTACAFSASDSVLEKVCVAAGACLDYLPNLKLRASKPTKNPVLKAFNWVGSAAIHATAWIMTPLLGLVSLFILPFQALQAALDKIIGINFDEVDKFADAFAASYGLGPDLASALEKEKNTTSIGSESYGRIFRLYADIFCASSLAYTYASGKSGRTNTGAVLPRIDTLIKYYEDLLRETKNKNIRKEIQGKIKALKIQYAYLKSLPSETLTPAALVTRAWANFFGSDTEAIDRFDREINGGKRRTIFKI